MSAFKGTPGPWVVGNTCSLLFGKQQGNGTEPIGFVYAPAFPERSEVGLRALADTRLIAAAPELLEALQDAVEHLNHHLPDSILAPHRAAIAKATGGAA